MVGQAERESAAAQARAGEDKGYISGDGDGAVQVVDAAQREQMLELGDDPGG